MRSIYLLLTSSGTAIAKAIRLVTNDVYSHASIAFDSELITLCSFGRRYSALPLPAGLVRESLYAGYLARHGDTPCALIELCVSDEAFRLARLEVSAMFLQSERYRYSLRGLAQCGRGVAEERPGYYFCSQFVGDILEKSGAANLPKPPSLMRPPDYELLPGAFCLFRGTVRELRDYLSHPTTPLTHPRLRYQGTELRSSLATPPPYVHLSTSR